VLAVQEVQNDTSALEELMHVLGSDWAMFVTVVTFQPRGGRRLRTTAP
jgi:hypothetical protein